MATRAEIEAALKHYEQVGNLDAARKLKATLGAIPEGQDGTSFTVVKQPQPGALEQGAREVVGAAEAGATLATGGVAAPLAGLGGGLYETARQILAGEFNPNDTSSIDEFAERAAQQATYQPRTAAGQRNVAAIGKVLEPVADDLPALTPITGGEINALTQGVRTAAQAGRAAVDATGVPSAIARTAARAGDAVSDGASRAATAVSDALPPLPGRAATPPPVAGPRSAGAAEVPAADIRRAGAAELGYKDDARLTKGQATQDPTEIATERNAAGMRSVGEPVRQRLENQARVTEGVFEKFIDGTGGFASDGRLGVGTRFEKALAGGAESQKNAIRSAFTTAEKKEGGLPSTGDTIAAYLKDNDAALSNASILDTATKQAKKLGIIDANGAGAATNVKTLYALRRFLSDNASVDGSNAFQARQLKGLIDERIAADGGPLYKQATELYARNRAQYKDASLINGILENKPGSPDRIIASEQILGRMFSPSTSVAEVKHARRLLQTHGGEEGAQAWRDIQAGGIEEMKRIAYDGVTAGPNGVKTPNGRALQKYIETLDKSGKLDAMYGKQGAEKLRLFGDVVRELGNTKGMNFSGTTNALIEWVESLPFGVGNTAAKTRKLVEASQSVVKDSSLRARIKENLK